MGAKIKATGESKLNDSPAFKLLTQQNERGFLKPHTIVKEIYLQVT